VDEVKRAAASRLMLFNEKWRVAQGS